MTMNEAVDVYRSTGNVFADLDIQRPETALLKAELAMRISELTDESGLSQQEVAKLFGVSQPRVSRLVRGHLEGFSIERLLRCLAALGQEVEIVVQPKQERVSAGLGAKSRRFVFGGK